jgi:hypothetical protein
MKKTISNLIYNTIVFLKKTKIIEKKHEMFQKRTYFASPNNLDLQISFPSTLQPISSLKKKKIN